MGIILLFTGILVATIIIKTICDKAYQRYWDGHYEKGEKPTKFEQACYDNSEALAIIFWLIIILKIFFNNFLRKDSPYQFSLPEIMM